jgi:PKD repeat protein
MTVRQIRTVLAVLALSVLFVPGIAASSVGAATPARHIGPAAYVPLRGAQAATGGDAALSNLDYNGGAVMPRNVNYLVFWSPKGLGAYGPGTPPEFVTGLEQYFIDLAHDSGGNQNVDSVSAQYNDRTGAFASYNSRFGGAILDTDPFPPSQCPVNAPVTNCLTDDQLQHELERLVSARGLPRDLTHEYFLMSPPHVENCFSSDASQSYGGCSAGEIPDTLAGYCAYHSNSSVAPMLLYSNDPYVVNNQFCDDPSHHPNGPSDAELVGGLSHEHNESITDPVPNDAWTNGAGPNHGEEVGDQCETENGTPLGTAPNGSEYNQVINGHFYWYQEEWSNQGHTCLQRLTSPEAKPTATFTVTKGGGLTLNFDATGSSASGGVAHYVWQFNDAFGASTVERTTPTISHTFPASGAYSVGLTVLGSDGVSTGTGGIVITGRNGFNNGFTMSPTAPAAGEVVHFSALTVVSNRTVITYHWEFGDGTTSGVGQPSHAYARPGTYRLKLVLFSGLGSAWPDAGAGPVVTRTIVVH